MDATRPRIAARWLGMATLLGLTAALLVALFAWHFLPYESLDRVTVSDRFLLWEAFLWAGGLALVFLGVSAVAVSTDPFAVDTGPYGAAFIERAVRDGAARRTRLPLVPAGPWIILSTGASMIVIATILRSLLEL